MPCGDANAGLIGFNYDYMGSTNFSVRGVIFSALSIFSTKRLSGRKRQPNLEY